MRERWVVAVAVAGSIVSAAGAWGVISAQAGCQLAESCDATTTYVPGVPIGVNAGPFGSGQGFQAGAGMYGAVWQTSPVEGQWMDFPGQRTYVIYPQLADGGPMVGPYTFPEVEVSADPVPSVPGSNYAQSAGNITEFSTLSDGGTTGFVVPNNTCSLYYLWMQVAQEYPPDAGATD